MAQGSPIYSPIRTYSLIQACDSYACDYACHKHVHVVNQNRLCGSTIMIFKKNLFHQALEVLCTPSYQQWNAHSNHGAKESHFECLHAHNRIPEAMTSESVSKTRK